MVATTQALEVVLEAPANGMRRRSPVAEQVATRA
jgi:hypothetical protein